MLEQAGRKQTVAGAITDTKSKLEQLHIKLEELERRQLNELKDAGWIEDDRPQLLEEAQPFYEAFHLLAQSNGYGLNLDWVAVTAWADEMGYRRSLVRDLLYSMLGTYHEVQNELHPKT